MTDRTRKLLPLGAGLVVVLALVLGARGLWPSPEVASMPGTTVGPGRAGMHPPPVPGESASVTPGAVTPPPAPRATEVSPKETSAGASEEGLPSPEVYTVRQGWTPQGPTRFGMAGRRAPCGPRRKNLEGGIAAFRRAFDAGQDVELWIHCPDDLPLG